MRLLIAASSSSNLAISRVTHSNRYWVSMAAFDNFRGKQQQQQQQR
jgi:hypothetical protein